MNEMGFTRDKGLPPEINYKILNSSCKFVEPFKPMLILYFWNEISDSNGCPLVAQKVNEIII